MMTGYEHIARPYAKAAFESAKEMHALSLWSSAFTQLACVIQDAMTQQLLHNPAVTNAMLTEFMLGFLHEANHQEKLTNFVQLLIERKRLAALPAIADLFQIFVAQHEGYRKVTVTSAFTLDDHEKKTVQSMLTKRFQSDISAEFAVNPDLIGGLLVRSGNWVLDGSVRGKLARLKSVMARK